LGCTLHFLLTGSPPFPEGTMAQRLMAHQQKQPDPIANKRPDVPPSLVDIINKMMAKKPDDRYPTARDTAQALHDWLAVNGGEAWAKMNSLGGHSSIMGSSVFVTGPGGSGANPGQSTAITSVPVAASPTVPIKSAAAETVADQDANLASFFSALRGGDAAAPAAPSSAPLVAAAAAPAAAVAIARPV